MWKMAKFKGFELPLLTYGVIENKYEFPSKWLDEIDECKLACFQRTSKQNAKPSKIYFTFMLCSIKRANFT